MDRLHALARDIDAEQMEAAAKDADTLRATWQLQRRMPSDTADLNDPHALSKDAPPRTESDSMGLGPSSMQVFEAEQFDEAAHKAATQQQLQSWNASLLADKAARQAAERDADAAYAAYSDSLVKAAEEAEQQWDSEAKAAQRAMLLAQKEQMRAARAAREAAAAAEREADRRHVQTQAAQLVEGRLGADGSRPRADQWKGFSSSQLKDIQATQAEQMAAKAAAAAAQRDEDAAYAAYASSCAQAAAEADAAAAREADAAARALHLDLKRQQREAARRRALEEAERKAPVDLYEGGGFFGGFGKSHR